MDFDLFIPSFVTLFVVMDPDRHLAFVHGV